MLESFNKKNIRAIALSAALMLAASSSSANNKNLEKPDIKDPNKTEAGTVSQNTSSVEVSTKLFEAQQQKMEIEKRLMAAEELVKEKQNNVSSLTNEFSDHVTTMRKYLEPQSNRKMLNEIKTIQNLPKEISEVLHGIISHPRNAARDLAGDIATLTNYVVDMENVHTGETMKSLQAIMNHELGSTVSGGGYNPETHKTDPVEDIQQHQFFGSFAGKYVQAEIEREMAERKQKEIKQDLEKINQSIDDLIAAQ